MPTYNPDTFDMFMLVGDKKDGLSVKNVMIVEKDINIGNSALTSLGDPLFIFERGAFMMTMDWQELLKYEFLFNEIRKIENPKVLDLGCGNSALRTISYRSRKRLQYVGVDIDKKVIERQYHGFTLDDTTWYVMNLSGKQLPFEDNEFDIVIASDVIEHLEKPDDGIMLLKESIRVGKNMIYMSTPNRTSDSVNEPTVRPPKFDEKGRLTNGHRYEYSNKEILTYLKDQPVEIISRYGSLITQSNLKKEFEKHPEIKKVMDMSSVRSTSLQDVICASFFPDSSKDVMYSLKKKHG